MESSSRSATTHIFFPPRFEVVAEQEKADGFSSHAGNQLAFDGFFRHQSHGPASAAFRRVTADHGDQPLFLVVVQHFRRSGPLPFIERSFQAALLITMANFADRLRRQWNHGGNARRTYPLTQLQKRQGAQNDSNRLHSAANQLLEFFLILGGDFDTQRRTTHTLSMRQNKSA